MYCVNTVKGISHFLHVVYVESRAPTQIKFHAMLSQNLNWLFKDIRSLSAVLYLELSMDNGLKIITGNNWTISDQTR